MDKITALLYQLQKEQVYEQRIEEYNARIPAPLEVQAFGQSLGLPPSIELSQAVITSYQAGTLTRGYYFPEFGTVMLNVAVPDEFYKSIVVHELAHALQYLNGSLSCPAQIGFPFGMPALETKLRIHKNYSKEDWRLEYEAFGLQEAWERSSASVEDWFRSQFSKFL